MNTNLIKICKYFIAILTSTIALGYIGLTIISFIMLKASYHMEEVIFNYAIIIVASLLACFLFCSLTEQNKIRHIIKKVTLSVIFTYYCFLLVYLLFLSRSYMYLPLGEEGLLERIRMNTNFVPFKTIHAYLNDALKGERIALTNILGNLLAFMPMAFFLPIYLKKLVKSLSFTMWMFGIIQTISAKALS